MIELDGSHGEGGGAMLRTALGLSVITGKPFRMTDVRKGRDEPGLKREHLHCIRILQKLCGAKCDGDSLGSGTVMFIPGEVKAGRVEHDLETAASATLVAQCLILSTIFSGKKASFTLSGGTDVKWSIPSDYLGGVVAPSLAPLGEVNVRILKRGYYPRGGGLLEVTVKGRYLATNPDLPAFDLTGRGELLVVQGVCHASQDLEGARVCERMRLGAAGPLSRHGPAVSLAYSDTLSTGAGIALWARFERSALGADALGERGVPAEKVGEEAAKRLAALISSDAAVDEHLADQLIPYLAVCGGSVRAPAITDHLRSNIYVAERFLPVRFSIDEETGTVSCEKEEWADGE